MTSPNHLQRGKERADTMREWYRQKQERSRWDAEDRKKPPDPQLAEMMRNVSVNMARYEATLDRGKQEAREDGWWAHVAPLTEDECARLRVQNDYLFEDNQRSIAMGFIVPVKEGQQLQASEAMRRDAAASVANVEASGGPYLYLCNSDAQVVEERKEAAAGDFVVLGAGDKAINLGKSPMFIVLSQHKRFAFWTGKGNDRKLVWDAARDAMTDKQAAQADMDWSDPQSARPYDAYMLIHVSDKGMDPLSVGPIRYKSSAHTSDASKKWLASILGQAGRGVPMFAQVWSLTGKLKDTGHGSRKFTFEHLSTGQISDDSPAYKKLRDSWLHAQAMMGKAKTETATGIVDADDPHASSDDIVIEEGPADGAADNSRVLDAGQMGYGDEEVADGYATSLEPEVPAPAKALSMDFDTGIRCGKNAQGLMMKVPCCEMSANEAKVAWGLAAPHAATNKEAAAVHELLTAWANHKGWDIGQPGF